MLNIKHIIAVVMSLLLVFVLHIVSNGRLFNESHRRRRANQRACFANRKLIADAIELLRVDREAEGQPFELSALDEKFWTAAFDRGFLERRIHDPGWGKGTEHHYVLVGDHVVCLAHGTEHLGSSSTPKEQLIGLGVSDDGLLATAAELQSAAIWLNPTDRRFTNYLFVFAMTWCALLALRRDELVPQRHWPSDILYVLLFLSVPLGMLFNAHSFLWPISTLAMFITLICLGLYCISILMYFRDLLTTEDVLSFHDEADSPSPQFGTYRHREGVREFLTFRWRMSLVTLVFVLVGFTTVLVLGSPSWQHLSISRWNDMVRLWAWCFAIGACSGLIRYAWEVRLASEWPMRPYRPSSVLRLLALLVLLDDVSRPFRRWVLAGRQAGYFVVTRTLMPIMAFFVGRHLVLTLVLGRAASATSRVIETTAGKTGESEGGRLRGISSTPSRPLASSSAGTTVPYGT